MLLVGMVLVDLIHPAEWENPTPEQIRLIKMCCDTFGLPRGLHDQVWCGSVSHDGKGSSSWQIFPTNEDLIGESVRVRFIS